MQRYRFAILFLLPVIVFSASPARAQTTVAVSALGSIRSDSGNDVIRQVPANSAGFMLELRHISDPLVGYDLSYSFRGADQLYEYRGPACVGSACPPTAQPVNTDAHQLALNWIVSLPISNVRVFALAGGGFERFEPTSSQAAPTHGQTRGLFDYGAGLDWGLLPHLGLRLQVRGNVYKAPALADAFSSTGKFTHDLEPMAGAYFRF